MVISLADANTRAEINRRNSDQIFQIELKKFENIIDGAIYDKFTGDNIISVTIEKSISWEMQQALVFLYSKAGWKLDISQPREWPATNPKIETITIMPIGTTIDVKKYGLIS